MRPPLTPPQPRARSYRTLVGILLTFVAVFCFALAGFIASRIVGVDAGGTTIALLEAVFGLAFVAGLRLSTIARLPKGAPRGGRWQPSDVLWLTLAAVTTAVGVGSFYTALAHEDLSVVAPITGSVPLVSFAFILLLLRGEERLTPRVVLGAMLVVIGVVLIGVTNR